MRGWKLVLALVVAVGVAACSADGPLSGGRVSTVTMRFLTPATVKSLIVEVTGPGIDPAVVMNIAVGADTVATGSLTLPSGSARRFVVTAVDTAGVQTHRADTTLTLQPGANPNLAMRLEPLPSTLGIAVTFGGVRLVVPDTSMRVLTVDDSTTIVAYAIRANDDTVPNDSLVWGSTNPAIATVNAGVVHVHRAGGAGITLHYRGAAAGIRVSAIANEVFRSCRALRDATPGLTSGVYTLSPDGTSASATQAYCDQVTDGGGWTRVLGFRITDNTPSSVVTYEGNEAFSAAASEQGAMHPATLGAYMSGAGASEIRFLCEKASVGRRLHIKTSNPAVIAYLTGASDEMPLAQGTFDRLGDDTSLIGQQPTRWGRDDSNSLFAGRWGHTAQHGWGLGSAETRLIDHTMFIGAEAVWAPGGASEWVRCDDLLPSGFSGFWHIYVR